MEYQSIWPLLLRKLKGKDCKHTKETAKEMKGKYIEHVLKSSARARYAKWEKLYWVERLMWTELCMSFVELNPSKILKFL